jgi:hypothetical protein
MSTLKISGTIYDANGMDLAVSIYDADGKPVYQKDFTKNFNDSVDLDSGTYTLDLEGATQGSMAFTIDGYDKIDHTPPKTYDKKITDEFTITIN